MPPQVVMQLRRGAWLYFVLFLFICFPLAFLAFFMKVECRICPICGVDVGDETWRVQQAADTQWRREHSDPAASVGLTLPQKLVIGGALAVVLLVVVAFILLQIDSEPVKREPENLNERDTRYDISTPTPSPSATPRKVRTPKAKPTPNPDDPIIIETAPSVEPTRSGTP